MKLYLKTLTPLHIGTGIELDPIDYVVTGNHYYRIPQKIALKFIQQHELLNNYTKWIEEVTDKISNLELERKKQKGNKDLNQQLSDLRKNFNLLEFAKKNKKETEFKEFLQNNKWITKTTINDKTPDKKIRVQIKDGTGKPYIPGTSIKGAIRTSLLYHWLVNNNGCINAIKEIIFKELKDKERGNLEEHKKNFADSIENNAFYCGIENNNKIDYRDEKFDLLKLLLISDGKIINSENPLNVIPTYLYLSDNTRQSQSPWVEAIAAGNIVEFSIDFNIDFLFNMKDKIENDSIIIDGKRQWIGLETKTKEIFNLDIRSLTKESIEEQKQKVLQNILHMASVFSRKQMEWNDKWKKEITPKKNKGGNLKEDFKKNKIDFSFSQNKMCLNLGFASGFTGTTEFLYLLDSDELKNAFKQVMEKFGIGDKKNRDEGKGAISYTANPDKFPKSKVMFEANNKIQPLGWVEILTEIPSNDGKTHRNQNKTVTSSEPFHSSQKEKFQPKPYTGKITQGATKIPAQVVKSGQPNRVKLLVEGQNLEMELHQCHFELPEGQYVYTTITDYDGAKKIIKRLRFDGLIK